MIHDVEPKHPPEAKRSPKWPRVRATHLALHNQCALCGNRKNLEVHHIESFHERPELELEPSNLITLCEDSDAPLTKGLNCHQWCGHLGRWKSINPRVKQLVGYFSPFILASRKKRARGRSGGASNGQ